MPRGIPASPTGLNQSGARGRPVPARIRRLLHFSMVRVLAALAAKFAELETFRRGFAVLGRRVILILTRRALQLNNFASHMSFLSITRQLGRRALSGSEPGYRRAACWPPTEGFRSYRISVIVPAPTVRPPSRIAKRRPFSMATGVISSISSATLSPGITISTPSGNFATPVTSVVRK